MSEFDADFTVDLTEESVNKLRKALKIDELDEIYKRFKNGTETEDDLINNTPHYVLKNDDGLDLNMVEYKYYLKIIDLYKKAKLIIEAYENKVKERKTIINNDLDMSSKEHFARMEEVKEFEQICYKVEG